MSRGRQLELKWAEHEGHDYLRVSGWTESEIRELGGLTAAKLSRRLAVLPSELVQDRVDFPSVQGLAGRFEIDQDAIWFVPRFPFREGLSYSLLVDPVLEARPVDSRAVWTIQRPARDGAPTTEVVAIYPSAPELPVNQLKLYVHFSSPMSEGWVARAVYVRRADNDDPLDGVFLSMEPELWDPDRRRLTLLLDPGRIKRGLVPNAEEGYPLIEGVQIIVTIGTEFRDAAGQPLRTSSERNYEVGPPLRVHVNPADWQYRYPIAGSTDPLIVAFDRPLDHALLEHCLWVNDAENTALAGRAWVDPGERCWRFEPQSPWQDSRYLVIVDPRLEDLAGNSLIRVFDRDLMRAQDTPTDGRPVAIEFICGELFHPDRHESP